MALFLDQNMSNGVKFMERIKDMTVNELKAELKARGASTQGKKAELQARLMELTSKSATKSLEQSNLRLDADLSSSTGLSSGNSGVMNNLDHELTAAPSQLQPLVNSNNFCDVNTESSKASASENQKSDGQPFLTSESLGGETEMPVTTRERDTSSSIQDRVKEKMKEIQLQKHTTKADLPTSSGPAIQAEGNRFASEEKQQTVRIDNFQRPLNVKALISWLSETLGEEVTEDRLWINAIKTHCYIDFPSKTSARKCIDIITGKRYPSSSTAQLIVSFTDVSSKEAPVAVEAALKPGEWKSMLPAGAVIGGGKDTGSAVGSKADSSSSVLGQKKLETVENDTTRKEIVSDPDKNQVTVRERMTGEIAKKRRKEPDSNENHVTSPSLDQLFKKTQSLPVIYWQPVTDEIVEQRRSKRQRVK